MLGALCYFLIAGFAFSGVRRLRLVEDLPPIVRRIVALGVAQFLGAWLAFAIYLGCGMNRFVLGVVLLLSAAINVKFFRPCQGRFRSSLENSRAWLRPAARWSAQNAWLIGFAGLFVMPFVLGLRSDDTGAILSAFNFLDTSGHLSIAHAFLAHPRFPPMDLDLAGQPLNYHFLADFLVAFLSLGDLDLIKTLATLNVVNAIVTSVTLWVVVEHWIKPSSALVTATACAAFCFTVPVACNALHYSLFPIDDGDWRTRLFYPFFNFEFTIQNLLEPQRSLLFSLPIILLVAHGLSRVWEDWNPTLIRETAWLIALLPFAHATSFLVLAACFAATILRHRRLALRELRWLVLPAAVVTAQLVYIKIYCPPFTPFYAGWDVAAKLAPSEIASAPLLFRRLLFWLLVDGDFLVIGTIGLCLLFAWRRCDDHRRFLRQPIVPFLVIFSGFFVLINFYRFSRNWGDSNKFVLFLNLWLVLIAAQQLAMVASRWWGRVIAVGWLSFSLLPYLLHAQTSLRNEGTLFSKEDALAAAWIKSHTRVDDVFITCSGKPRNLVSALAGRPVVQGSFAYNHPYYDGDVANKIRRLYERLDCGVLVATQAKYILVGAQERAVYHLNPVFDDDTGLVFGTDSRDGRSVQIFDAQLLRESLR